MRTSLQISKKKVRGSKRLGFATKFRELKDPAPAHGKFPFPGHGCERFKKKRMIVKMMVRVEVVRLSAKAFFKETDLGLIFEGEVF